MRGKKSALFFSGAVTVLVVGQLVRSIVASEWAWATVAAVAAAIMVTGTVLSALEAREVSP